MATSNFTSNYTINMYPAMIGLQDLPPVLRNITWLDCDPQRDCTVAAKRLIEELLDDDLSAISVSSSGALVKFARACAPVPLTKVSDEQILDWNFFFTLNQSISVLNLTDQVNQGCHREFCQNLDWEGDPDLSGPGIFTAYLIQAVLTSAFFLFYVCLEIAEWNFRRRNPGKVFSLKQLPHVFQSCLPYVNRCFDVFWITPLYFGLAISAATYAINSFLSNLTESKVSRYVTSFSFLGTVFSWSATVALLRWGGTRRGTREPPGGVYLPFLFFTVGTVAVALTVPSYVWSYQASSPSTSPFETYCLGALGAYESFGVFWIFTTSCVFAACTAFVVSIRAVLTIALHRQDTRTVGRLLKITGSVIAFCCFILMWASLAFFIRLRSESSGLSDKGRDGDLRWGFGQIVAVAGWLPMAFEIGTVTRDILSRRFRAWRGRDDREHVESAVAGGDNNKTAPKTKEEKVKSNGGIKPKKVKTW